MNDHYYETGSTQPPKSRVWFVLLLVLIIFVSGIITALGLLNIKVWGTFSLGREKSVPIEFTRVESTAPAQSVLPQAAGNASLGVATETVGPFISVYYQLPRGVYIPRVPAGSHAAHAGILPGDVLLQLDGHRIKDTGALDSLLLGYRPGDPVELRLYRDGQELAIKMTLEQGN